MPPSRQSDAPIAAPSAPVAGSGTGEAQTYVVEWVYRIRYGFQDEWWRLFQKYQIAALDEQQRRGHVLFYRVLRPGVHTNEDARWDYRIEITYNGRDAARHEDEVVQALFPDHRAWNRDETRRWELTESHWDLPIHDIDPHAPAA